MKNKKRNERIIKQYEMHVSFTYLYHVLKYTSVYITNYTSEPEDIHTPIHMESVFFFLFYFGIWKKNNRANKINNTTIIQTMLLVINE